MKHQKKNSLFSGIRLIFLFQIVNIKFILYSFNESLFMLYFVLDSYSFFCCYWMWLAWALFGAYCVRKCYSKKMEVLPERRNCDDSKKATVPTGVLILVEFKRLKRGNLELNRPSFYAGVLWAHNKASQARFHRIYIYIVCC